MEAIEPSKRKRRRTSDYRFRVGDRVTCRCQGDEVDEWMSGAVTSVGAEQRAYSG